MNQVSAYRITFILQIKVAGISYSIYEGCNARKKIETLFI